MEQEVYIEKIKYVCDIVFLSIINMVASFIHSFIHSTNTEDGALF